MNITRLILFSFITLTAPITTAMREESSPNFIQFSIGNGTWFNSTLVKLQLKDHYTFTYSNHRFSPNDLFVAIQGSIHHYGDHAHYVIIVCDVANNKVVYTDTVPHNCSITLTDTILDCHTDNNHQRINLNKSNDFCTSTYGIDDITLSPEKLNSIITRLIINKNMALGVGLSVCAYGIYRFIKSRRAKNNEQKPDPVLQEFLTTPLPHTTETTY